MLFCSRYIYLRETFVLGMLPGPLPTWRPRWKTQVAPAYLQRLFLEELHKPLFRMSLGWRVLGWKRNRRKNKAGGGVFEDRNGVHKLIWAIQVGKELLDDYVWMLSTDNWEGFLPFKSSLWRIKKYILFSMCGSHEGLYTKKYCWWFRNPKQPPEMHETLQITGIFTVSTGDRISEASKVSPRQIW